jgi:hypothetical protein
MKCLVCSLRGPATFCEVNLAVFDVDGTLLANLRVEDIASPKRFARGSAFIRSRPRGTPA